MGRLNSQNKLDDIDKLLKIAESTKKVKAIKPNINPEIDRFLLENKISSGKTKVPTSVIYYKYYIWKIDRLISRAKFFSYFKTKFQKTRTDHGIGYLLNPAHFDLTPVGFFKARAFLRKERDEAKKEK